MPELEAKDFHYCVTLRCKYKLPRLATVLPPCPECGSTEFVNFARKVAIDKGVASAQAKLPTGATADPKAGDKDPAQS